MKKYLTVLLFAALPSSIFSIAGLGISVNQSLFSVGESSSPLVVDIPSPNTEVGSFTHHGFDNGFGLGGYLYLDIIPVFDLDVEYNFVGNTYKFSFDNELTPNVEIDEKSFAYLSGNTYITIQKSVFDLGIPFLAGADLYAGVGYNMHVATPMIDQNMLASVVSGGNIKNGTLDEDKLKDYLTDNALEASGFHLQGGLKFNLLTFDLFAYYRYTIAKDVMPGNAGFGSFNFRFGFGI